MGKDGHLKYLEMNLLQIFVIPFLVASAKSECNIHQSMLGYHNISDLGLAALKNDANAVKDLIEKGCDVNYAGAAVVLTESDYHYYDDNGGDKEHYDDTNNDEKDDNSTEMLGGLTALQIAASHGNAKFIKKLLTASDIAVDSKTDWGGTPLHEAARIGYINILEMLHEAGADVNAADEEGYTPLHVATIFDQLKAMKTLIT